MAFNFIETYDGNLVNLDHICMFKEDYDEDNHMELSIVCVMNGAYLKFLDLDGFEKYEISAGNVDEIHKIAVFYINDYFSERSGVLSYADLSEQVFEIYCVNKSIEEKQM